MSKLTRAALTALGGLVVLGALLLVALSFVDPNRFKPQIQSLFEKAAGMPLVIHGDLSLSLFPTPSLVCGRAEVASLPGFGPDPMATVEGLRASLSLFSLFSGRVRLHDLSAHGLRVSMITDEDGRRNWRPERKEQGSMVKNGDHQGAKTPSGALTLDSLTVRDAVLIRQDKRTGRHAELTVERGAVHRLEPGQDYRAGILGVLSGYTPSPVAIELIAEFSESPDEAGVINLALVGTADDSRYNFFGTLGRKEGRPRVEGLFEIDSLVLDRYIPSARQRKASQKQNRKSLAAARTRVRAERLRLVDMDLDFRIDKLMVKGVMATGLRATVTGRRGVWRADPISVDAGGGSAEMNVVIDAMQTHPPVLFSGQWDPDLKTLLEEATGKGPASGDVAATWSLTASGLDPSTISRTLVGEATVTLTNGSIPLLAILPRAIPGLPRYLAVLRCNSTWAVRDGVAANDDLLLEAASLRATGEGTVNLERKTLNYDLRVMLPMGKDGPELTLVPIRVSGPLASPRIRLHTGLLEDGVAVPKEAKDKIKRGIGRARRLLTR